MKTLIITMEYPPKLGGIASYVFEQAGTLPTAETYVLAESWDGDKDFDQQNQWVTYRFRFLFYLFWPRWLKLFFKAASLIKKHKIERVVVHHVFPVGYVAYLLKIFWRVKYIVFFHGTDVNLAARKKFFLDLICKGANKLVVNSHYLENRLSEVLNKSYPIQVVNPCPGKLFFEAVDQVKVDRLKAELGISGKKVLFTAARISDGKGFFRLAGIFKLLLEIYPDLVWLIAGGGPKESKLADYINQIQLGGVVRFLGPLAYKDLPKYYCLADVFVLLSHPENYVNESWGGVFIEAGAARVPVVAGRAGGVEEAVLDGKTGIVVDSNDDDAVYNAIKMILGDKNLARELGTAGRKHAEDILRGRINPLE